MKTEEPPALLLPSIMEGPSSPLFGRWQHQWTSSSSSSSPPDEHNNNNLLMEGNSNNGSGSCFSFGSASSGGCFTFGSGGGGSNSSSNSSSRRTTNTKLKTTRGNTLLVADDTEDHDATDLVAAEMNKLSLTEREQVYEDLHGVSVPIDETYELRTESLYQMEHQIQAIHRKPAYDLAQSISNEFVQDIFMRVMFLRAHRFDPMKAAKYFVKWFDWKLELFGQEKLCHKHLLLKDLEEDAQFMIESGICQYLPTRDSCGRICVVMAENYHRRLFKTTRAMLQTLFYCWSAAAEDETNQINGLVNITYSLGDAKDSCDGSEIHDQDFAFKVSQFISCIPVRLEAFHVLMAPTRSHFGWVLFASAVERFTRARLKFHMGSRIECDYALLSFGIPSTTLPFTHEGDLKPTNHKKWIQRRLIKDQAIRSHLLQQQQQQQSQSQSQSSQQSSNSQNYNYNYIFPGIDLPSRSDVLLGAGKPIQDHAGNQRLRELMHFYLEEYKQANKNGGKADVGRKIVYEILNQTNKNKKTTTNTGSGTGSTGTGGGRFLQVSKDKNLRGWWEEVSNEDLLVEKVCNGLRTTRLRTKITPQKITSSSKQRKYNNNNSGGGDGDYYYDEKEEGPSSPVRRKVPSS